MSGHNTLQEIKNAEHATLDPGSGVAIVVDRFNQVIPLTIAASTSETNTLAAPLSAGNRLRLFAASVGSGGSRTVTVASAINQDGDTTIVFDAVDEWAILESVPVGSDVYEWRVTAAEGATGGAGLDLVVDSLTATSASVTTLTVETVAVTVEAAEHGAGAIGTGVAPKTYRHTENGVIITEIKVDLEGLASVATANDVIGLAAGALDAYLGQYVVATYGVVFKIELICLETPAGGDNDVNIVAASSGTLAYDEAGGTTYGVNGGDAVAGQVVQNLVQGLTANHYFYLTAGTGDTAATYTAGQFLIRLHGHPVLT